MVGLWVVVVVVVVWGAVVVNGLVVDVGALDVVVVCVDSVVVIVVGLVPVVPGLVRTQEPSIQTPPFIKCPSGDIERVDIVRGYRTVSFTAAVVSAGIVIGTVDIARPVTDWAQWELVPTIIISL